jgi:tetratricopeptide (TPR) repeat protein
MVLALVLGLLAAPALALAAEPSAAVVEKAVELVSLGNTAYREGNFAAALGHYQEAYRLRPTAKILFNRAQCHRKLRQHERALSLYNEYLLREPTAVNRTEVERLLGELEAEVRTRDEKLERLRPRASSVLPSAAAVAAGSAAVVAIEPREQHWYRRWYVWATVGAVVVAAVVAGAVVSAQGSGAPSIPATDFGTRGFFGGQR